MRRTFGGNWPLLLHISCPNIDVFWTMTFWLLACERLDVKGWKSLLQQRWVWAMVTSSVFSPAYLRDMAPLSLQCSFVFVKSFDVDTSPTQNIPSPYAFIFGWGEHCSSVHTWRPMIENLLYCTCTTAHHRNVWCWYSNLGTGTGTLAIAKKKGSNVHPLPHFMLS